MPLHNVIPSNVCAEIFPMDRLRWRFPVRPTLFREFWTLIFSERFHPNVKRYWACGTAGNSIKFQHLVFRNGVHMYCFIIMYSINITDMTTGNNQHQFGNITCRSNLVLIGTTAAVMNVVTSWHYLKNASVMRGGHFKFT